MYLIFDSVSNLDGPQNRGWLKFGTVEGYHHIMVELLVETAYVVFAVKDFHINDNKHCDICLRKHYWQYLCRSWSSNGIIPEKVTWVQFPAWINTVCSKLLPINTLFFQYLISRVTYLLLQIFLQNIRPGNTSSYVVLVLQHFCNFFILLCCKMPPRSGSSLEAVELHP